MYILEGPDPICRMQHPDYRERCRWVEGLAPKSEYRIMFRVNTTIKEYLYHSRSANNLQFWIFNNDFFHSPQQCEKLCESCWIHEAITSETYYDLAKLPPLFDLNKYFSLVYDALGGRSVPDIEDNVNGGYYKLRNFAPESVASDTKQFSSLAAKNKNYTLLSSTNAKSWEQARTICLSLGYKLFAFTDNSEFGLFVNYYGYVRTTFLDLKMPKVK